MKINTKHFLLVIGELNMISGLPLGVYFLHKAGEGIGRFSSIEGRSFCLTIPYSGHAERKLPEPAR